MKQIVEIQVKRMKKYLIEKGIDIILTDAVKDRLAEIGYDPVYGARPLKRVIQREILNPLAVKILEGSFRQGDVIEVEVGGDTLVFRKMVEAETKV